MQRIRHPLAGVNLIRLSEEREVNVRRLPAEGKTGKRGAISRVPFVGGELFLGPAGDLCERTEQRPACVRELVGDGDGWSVVDRACREPDVAELGESVGEHRVTDAVDCARDGTESGLRRPRRPLDAPFPNEAADGDLPTEEDQ